ncbi:oleosin L-like [Musa acuminata AAA Group]|uniref:oleosin L-like n=1 Tax=Musa acuminata AAA Group TaxID=214697 RepID=UPI0031D67744
MAEYGIDQSYRQGDQQQVVVKAVVAAVAGMSLLVLSGLTLAWTVIALAVATPLLMIFSPVLVPAAIVVLLLAAGFLASGGLGVAALAVLWWMYKDLTGKQPPGVELLEQVRQRLVSKARDIRESLQQQQQQLHEATQ